MTTDAAMMSRARAKRMTLMINCVLIFMVPLSDNIHRLRLYLFKALQVEIIPVIRYRLLTGEVVIDHPSSFVFHGRDKRLVKRERKLGIRPDRCNVCVIGTQSFLMIAFASAG